MERQNQASLEHWLKLSTDYSNLEKLTTKSSILHPHPITEMYFNYLFVFLLFSFFIKYVYTLCQISKERKLATKKYFCLFASHASIQNVSMWHSLGQSSTVTGYTIVFTMDVEELYNKERLRMVYIGIEISSDQSGSSTNSSQRHTDKPYTYRDKTLST